jgi:hypothetical protein
MAMNNLMNGAVGVGKRYAPVFTAIVLAMMVSGCQSMDTMKTGSISTKTAMSVTGKKVHYVKKQRLHRIHRNSLMQTSSVTRVREEAYSIFVRPQRVPMPAPAKVSYTLGSAGPLLGHSPWICGPSGFGQRANCYSRF